MLFENFWLTLAPVSFYRFEKPADLPSSPIMDVYAALVIVSFLYYLIQ